MVRTLSQGYAFLLYLYAGIALRLVYGALHALAARLGGRGAIHACDAVFSCVFCVVAYAAVALADSGVVRLYGPLTMLGGAMLARWAFRGVICKRIVKRRA